MSVSAQEQDWLLGTAGSDVREFYTSIGVNLPDRGGTETQVRCFANSSAHKHDDRAPSCSVNLITGLWKCHGCGQSGNPYQAALALGRSEQQARDLARRRGLFLEVAPKEKASLPGERQLKQWRERLQSSPEILQRLQELRGWTPEAIRRLSLGWDGERLVFPIRSPRLKLAGVVRYLPGGKPKTLALPGTKRGLFPAPEIIGRDRPLFIVEGEPDAVAVWSTGHPAVGIPGAGSWRQEWGTRFLGRRVIVLADCDQQGRDLATRIRADVAAQIIDLDPTRHDGYDIGDIVREASADGGLGQVSRLLERFAA